MMAKVNERYYLLIITAIAIFISPLCTNPVKVECLMEDRQKAIGLTVL